MDSVQKVLEDLDPELPYFITDVSCLLHSSAVLGAATHCLPVLQSTVQSALPGMLLHAICLLQCRALPSTLVPRLPCCSALA